MPLWFAGARNKNNLQRRTIRYIFGDETWCWPQGHMAEAEARVTAYGGRGKCVFMSQGSTTGDDTDRAFRSTDMREWCFVCPECGKEQAFSWSQMVWNSKRDGKRLPLAEILKTVHYRCDACGKAFTPEQRAALNRSGRFVAMNPDAIPGTIGFHWNAMATMDWTLLVAEYLEAKRHSRRGTQDSLREFYQKRLAESWGVDSGIDESEFNTGVVDGVGYKFGDEWGEESVFDEARKCWCSAHELRDIGGPKTPLRFMTVDVQESHFYYVVRGWNTRGDSRLIARGMTMEVTELESVRAKHNVRPNLFFIDAHYKTQIIKTLCIQRGYTALMGDRREAFPHTKNGKTIMRPYSKRVTFSGNAAGSGSLFMFSNRAIKDTLAEIRAGKTEMKWEIPRDIDVGYLKQINAEYFNEERQMWVCPERRDNHFFDCETMQICAALMLKIIGKESVAVAT